MPIITKIFSLFIQSGGLRDNILEYGGQLGNGSDTNRIRMRHHRTRRASIRYSSPPDHRASVVWGSALAEMPNWELYVTLLDSVKECYEAFVGGVHTVYLS